MFLPPQAECQQVTTFLGQKEDERSGSFKSCIMRVSGRDSGVRAAGAHLGAVQNWGGVGIRTVLASVGVVAQGNWHRCPQHRRPGSVLGQYIENVALSI